MLTNQKLVLIFSKTKGHCHFCGDRLDLKKYAKRGRKNERGAWELDHVIQRDKGGKDLPDNYLPACIPCNRLRWHRKGKELRDLIFLGLISKYEINHKTMLCKSLLLLKNKRKKQNKKRRRAL